MKTRHRFGSFLLITLAVVSNATASWIYSGLYPWVWDDANGWSYLSEKSELVWSANSQEWILNPYGDSIDLRGIESRDRWWLEISNGENLWTLVLYPENTNNSVDKPFLLFGEEVYDLHFIEYSMMVNELNGTVLLHVTCDSERVTANFSLLLDFADLYGGSYRLIGNLPESASSPAESVKLIGDFLLK